MSILLVVTGLLAAFSIVAWLLGEPLYAILLMAFALGLAVPAMRWRRGTVRGKDYPYDRRAFYSKEARLRRAQITTSVSRLRMREPFFKLLRILAWLLFFTHVAWLLYMVIAAYVWRTDGAIFANVFVYYMAAVIELVAILGVVGLYAWVKRREPHTMKLTVGDSPLLVGDVVPGTHTDTVDLLTNAAGELITGEPEHDILGGGSRRRRAGPCTSSSSSGGP